MEVPSSSRLSDVHINERYCTACFEGMSLAIELKC